MNESMTLQDRKIALIQWLTQIHDTSSIEALEKVKAQLLNRGTLVPPQRMTVEELVADIQHSEADIEAGKTISIEDLERESENW